MARHLAHIRNMKTTKSDPMPPSPSVLVLDKHGAPLPLQKQPVYAAKVAEIVEVERVEKRIRGDLERDRARARANRPAVISTRTKDEPTKPKRSPIDLVKALAAGGAISRHPPESGIEASERELQITSDAKIQLHAELREIVRDLSHQVDKHGASDDYGALADLYSGLAVAAEAVRGISQRRAHKLSLGYTPFNGFVLPSGFVCADRIPAPAYMIGDGADIRSELGRFRQWLVDEKVMK
jgi:hypothetical protein